MRLLYEDYMRLIIVDGLDGVGKDTHANLIKKRYEKKGEKVIIRSHPESDNYFGKKTKKALLSLGKLNQIKASIYYLFDVLRSIKIFYNKKNCETLIMVRYLMGTAYLPDCLVDIGYNFFYNFVPTSEYKFFLDASPELLVKRLEKRDKKEIFETKKALKKVRKKSIKLAKDWIIIDTSKPINEVAIVINKKLDTLDKKNK